MEKQIKIKKIEIDLEIEKERIQKELNYLKIKQPYQNEIRKLKL